MNRNLQIELVSRDTYSPYMEVKYINVNIVNRNMQIEVLSRDTYSLYMKVKLFNVNIVIRNTQKEVSLKTHIQSIHK